MVYLSSTLHTTSARTTYITYLNQLLVDMVHNEIQCYFILSTCKCIPPYMGATKSGLICSIPVNIHEKKDNKNSWTTFYLWGQWCQHRTWLVQCNVQRLASQTCCTGVAPHQCGGHAHRYPSSVGEPNVCLSLCPQRSSYPSTNSNKITHEHAVRANALFLLPLHFSPNPPPSGKFFQFSVFHSGGNWAL